MTLELEFLRIYVSFNVMERSNILVLAEVVFSSVARILAVRRRPY